MEREIATVGFRELLLAEAQPVSVLCSPMRIVWGLATQDNARYPRPRY